MMEPRKLSYTVEWHDSVKDCTRNFKLIVYPRESPVKCELLERPSGKLFLKKSVPSPRIDHGVGIFSLGSSINIWGRKLKLVGYADSVTRTYSNRERSAIIVSNTLKASDIIGNAERRTSPHPVKIDVAWSRDGLQRRICDCNIARGCGIFGGCRSGE